MELSVHYLEEHDPVYVRQLRDRLCGRMRLTVGREIEATPDYHILIGGRFEDRHLTASPNLHTVIIPWAGLPAQVREMLLHHPDITVHNLHYNAVAVAETAASLMLAVARRLIPADRAFRRHDWTARYQEHRSVMLWGKTALVLGFGHIGRRIGAICRGLGMKVIATRRQVGGSAEPETEVHSATDLLELLPRAHVVHVCLALTPETNGLLGKHELALLPDGAIVVNVARGPIIDEEALYAELLTGRIQAGLDVWYNYPRSEEERVNTPPSRFPFHLLESVAMTPHMAEHARETESRQIEEIAAMLNAAADGRPLPNRVFPERGY